MSFYDKEQEMEKKKDLGSSSKDTIRLLSVLWKLCIVDFPHVLFEFTMYFEPHW